MPCQPQQIGAALIALAFAFPPSLAFAAGAPQAAKAPHSPIRSLDVALNQQGLLQGQLLTSKAQAIPGGKVWLVGAGGKPIAAPTNRDGRFAFKGLKPGEYCLAAGNNLLKCRVWTKRTAPPRSPAVLMMVAEEKVVRGQMGPPPMLNTFVRNSKAFFAHPLGMMTLGAAVATPIAIVAADGDDPPATP